MGTPAADPLTPDQTTASATSASFTLSPEYGQSLLKRTVFALGQTIPTVAQGRAAPPDTVSQHVRQRPSKPGNLGISQPAGLPQRPYSRTEQRLVRVYVADAAGDTLVEQKILDRRCPAAQPSTQVVGIETSVNRLRSHLRHSGQFGRVSALLNQIDSSKRSRFGKGKRSAVVQLQPYPFVLDLSLMVDHLEMPAEPQVNNDLPAQVKPQNQVLSTSPDIRDLAARSAALEGSDTGESDDVVAEYPHSHDTPSDKERLQPEPNRLYFRKFRHDVKTSVGTRAVLLEPLQQLVRSMDRLEQFDGFQHLLVVAHPCLVVAPRPEQPGRDLSFDFTHEDAPG